jgi:2-hydroxychromene-2-carboxylate isomerase
MYTLDFYFDCSSPWTYLAFETILPVAQRADVDFRWKPFLVGGVFNTINPSVYQNRENPVAVKQKYYSKDLQDWAAYVGITIGSPPVFPVNSVKIMRGAFVALEEGKLAPYARLAFERYWGELRDISQDTEVIDIVKTVGMDAVSFWDKITSQAYKDKLRANTEDLVARGGYGSPTMFLNDEDMYFGNDRIPLILSKLTPP